MSSRSALYRAYFTALAGKRDTGVQRRQRRSKTFFNTVVVFLGEFLPSSLKAWIWRYVSHRYGTGSQRLTQWPEPTYNPTHLLNVLIIKYLAGFPNGDRRRNTSNIYQDRCHICNFERPWTAKWPLFSVILPTLVVSWAHCVKVVDKAITIDIYDYCI